MRRVQASLSKSLEVLTKMLPGNDVQSMVKSEPAILLANPGTVSACILYLEFFSPVAALTTPHSHKNISTCKTCTTIYQVVYLFFLVFANKILF